MTHLRTHSRRGLLLALLISGLATLALSQHSLAQGDNLVSNGDFSADMNADQWPDDWPKGGQGISIEEEDGAKILRLEAQEPGKMLMVKRSVPVPPEVKAMELVFQARTTGLKPGKEKWFDARMILDFKDAAGAKLSSPGAPYLRNDTKGWKEMRKSFLVPENAASLDVSIVLFQVQSGVFEIKNISMTPIDAAAMQAEAEAKAKKAAEDQAASAAAMLEPANKEKWPAEIRVVGNQLQTADGKHVWLQGVNIMSLDWSHKGENVLVHSKVAIEDWKANILRLPIKDSYWFGKDGATNGGQDYRALVDAVIMIAANRGAYVLLDLHRYRAPRPEYVDFWKDAATRYKDHPAVIFDIMNEPYGTSWEVWRNGGFIEEKKKKTDEDTFVSEADRLKTREGYHSPGMQGLVDAVRSTGAKNVIAAGGLDYAYDLSGVVKGYALEDKGGNGIMYSTHIYNWKRGWQDKVLAAAEKYPIIVGEVGADVKKMDFIPAGAQEDPFTWSPDMIGLIQKHKLNWTAFSFHPAATPVMISDWNYTPTPFWGEFVKSAFAGKQFEVSKLR